MVVCFTVATLFAQSPTGDIAGTVYDTTGGVVPKAAVTLKNAATGFARDLVTNQDGQFSAASLSAGSYELQVQCSGFRSVRREVAVAAGQVTTADLQLEIGDRTEIVTVQAANPQLEFERHTVEQGVNRQQIQQLPLNGRNFLELAFLVPGVTVTAHNIGTYNRAFDVSVLGNDPDRTRIAVDGARINDPVDGGTQQNFSQEIVQEFQVSSANFDLSTGIAAGGAINAVTRTGTNQFHGSGFFFFRDHNMSAYPALQRNPLAPNPFFARRQSGAWFGAPLIRDRLFFFASYEHNNQHGVYSALPSDPAFRSLARIADSPFHQDLVNARLDYRPADRHTVFIRYSHDGNDSFAPRETNSLPSAWVSNTNYADSGVFSMTSGLRATLVNELRYSVSYWSNRAVPPTEALCPGCLGLGGPHVVVEGTGVSFGNQTNSPQSRLVRRHIFADSMTWQHSKHRVKFGGEWEYQKGTGTYTLDAPADILLFSPAEVRSAAPPLAALLPSSFNSLNAVLGLPLKSFIFGIGDINQPSAFHRDQADHDNLFHLYVQDTWKLRPRLTLNFGLAWSAETNALNHDLTKPAFLEPIFGQDGLGAPHHSWLRFTPALGFAWSLPDSKTVIRGGVGIYYDTLNIENRLVERAYLGPLGTGYLPLPGSIVPNPVPFVPGVPAGTPLEFRVPTAFSGAALNVILPLVRAGAAQALGVNLNHRDLTLRNIDVFKTGSDLFVRDFVPGSAQHLSLGFQRQFRTDIALTADFVYRHFIHQMLRGIDLNHFDAVGGPVIPPCTRATATTPGIECSNGPIGASISGGRSTYKALLVRAEKRFSHRTQGQVSYALQDQTGIYGMNALYTPITNLNNWFQNVGPASPRHVLNVSGIIDLPWSLQVSFISSFTSRAPFQPIITGADLYGTGVDAFLLPGSGTNRFNFGLGRSELVQLIDQYNLNYAGRPAPNPAQIFPAVKLPQQFDFGRNLVSQDLRVTKIVRFGEQEHVEWQIFAEVFNLLNIANLNGFTGNLLDPGFGQPTSRSGGAFGTGGTRAFQAGTRISF
jgi:hypothetical protein